MQSNWGIGNGENMNQQNLQKFRKLSQYEEEISIFKEYLEKLFSHIDDKNAEEYWEDFLDISMTMTETFEKLGYSSMNGYYNERLRDVRVTEKYFKSVIVELYNLSVEYLKAYKDSIRLCSLCKEKVIYLPMPDEYIENRKKYQLTESRSETLNMKEYICPVCQSLDRDRLIVAYLEQSKILMSPDVSLLQIAPSRPIEEYLFANYINLNYVSGDLFMEDVTFKLDLQDMKTIADESYDIWICSHVLEHVPDDKKALTELYRILKRNGRGILLVPLDLNVTETDEEVGCTEEENWRRFGQGDHVRRYAKQDFIKRITDSGFSLSSLGKEFFGPKLYKDNGLLDTATLYVLTK